MPFVSTFLVLLNTGPVGKLAGIKIGASQDLSSRPITFRLESIKGSVIDEVMSVSKRKSCEVMFPVPKKGDYRLKISAAGILKKSIIVRLTPGKWTTLSKVNIHVGDIDGNNRIDSEDVRLVKLYKGTDVSSKRWEFADDNETIRAFECDLNGDLVVDDKDLKIVTGNKGLRGSKF